MPIGTEIKSASSSAIRPSCPETLSLSSSCPPTASPVRMLVPKVALQHASDPVGVLLEEGRVQVQAFAQRLGLIGALLGAQDRATTSPGSRKIAENVTSVTTPQHEH